MHKGCSSKHTLIEDQTEVMKASSCTDHPEIQGWRNRYSEWAYAPVCKAEEIVIQRDVVKFLTICYLVRKINNKVLPQTIVIMNVSYYNH